MIQCIVIFIHVPESALCASMAFNSAASLILSLLFSAYNKKNNYKLITKEYEVIKLNEHYIKFRRCRKDRSPSARLATLLLIMSMCCAYERASHRAMRRRASRKRMKVRRHRSLMDREETMWLIWSLMPVPIWSVQLTKDATDSEVVFWTVLKPLAKRDVVPLVSPITTSHTVSNQLPTTTKGFPTKSSIANFMCEPRWWIDWVVLARVAMNMVPESLKVSLNILTPRAERDRVLLTRLITTPCKDLIS